MELNVIRSIALISLFSREGLFDSCAEASTPEHLPMSCGQRGVEKLPLQKLFLVSLKGFANAEVQEAHPAGTQLQHGREKTNEDKHL